MEQDKYNFDILQTKLTLTGLHELTLPPEHLGERAAAAGEHLLHGCTPLLGGKVPPSSARENALWVSLRVWRRSAVTLERCLPLSISPLKTPHDLSCAPPPAASPLTADQCCAS
ncbi:hypothetical protein CesoFtcFv8_011122 [Champsocephalus esox]|uniref:Uncharacterized protein n=2 Tax=Champsocephalus TaxID=52236 RepID=A0AAN8DI53_CHAGU|nr:hypothetical protein CesoFtcFv8_011122 [Champsocephalus esox]KAK5923471.1 hypothetical protein CgunFtcFv8_000437 [Champsocephalus gunnari]